MLIIFPSFLAHHHTVASILFVCMSCSPASHHREEYDFIFCMATNVSSGSPFHSMDFLSSFFARHQRSTLDFSLLTEPSHYSLGNLSLFFPNFLSEFVFRSFVLVFSHIHPFTSSAGVYLCSFFCLSRPYLLLFFQEHTCKSHLIQQHTTTSPFLFLSSSLSCCSHALSSSLPPFLPCVSPTYRIRHIPPYRNQTSTSPY